MDKRTFAITVRTLSISMRTLAFQATQEMIMLAMERSTLTDLAMSNDALAILAVFRAKILGEERMTLVESDGSLVVSYESLV